MVVKGKLDYVRAVDVSHTVGLSENAIYEFIRCRGRLLEGFMVYGKPKLAEQFFVNVIPYMRKIKYVLPPASCTVVKVRGRGGLRPSISVVSPHLNY